MASTKRTTDTTNEVPEKLCKTTTKKFEHFRTSSILCDDPVKKSVVVHGNFQANFKLFLSFYLCLNLNLVRFKGTFSNDSETRSAVVILEKKPFTPTDIDCILGKETEALLHLENDVYSSADLYPPSQINGEVINLI